MTGVALERDPAGVGGPARRPAGRGARPSSGPWCSRCSSSGTPWSATTRRCGRRPTGGGRWVATSTTWGAASTAPSRTRRVGWVGLAAGSWTVAGAEVGRGLEELADRSLDVGDCLDEAASAVHETERLVRDLVRELLEWAALTLAVSAVTGLVTLGASTLAGAASAAAKAAVTGSRIAALVRRLAAVLRRIQDRVDAYRDWVQGLSTLRRTVVERAEQQVVSAVVKKPLRGATSEATGMDGQVRRPLESLVGAPLREHRVPT